MKEANAKMVFFISTIVTYLVLIIYICSFWDGRGIDPIEVRIALALIFPLLSNHLLNMVSSIIRSKTVSETKPDVTVTYVISYLFIQILFPVIYYYSIKYRVDRSIPDAPTFILILTTNLSLLGGLAGVFHKDAFG